MSIDKIRVVIQGMGKAGGITAKQLHELGATVIAVSDVSGGLYRDSGLDIPDIMSYLATKGNLLKDYEKSGATHISNEELFSLQTDVLIPAALENQITEINAPNIKARIIVEAANGPTTVEADKILNEKGVIIVPDILANAGGVVVSYFEWVQNLQFLRWELEEINNRLNGIMTKAFETVYALHLEKNFPLRTSAYMLALKRLVAAKKTRGLFP
jgi:glutamate dehydrogenase/leucine dehydrogenase